MEKEELLDKLNAVAKPVDLVAWEKRIKNQKKENFCGYSDEWQPYKGDYDKFEYDIKLKDGTVVENCYPNAGKFNSISDTHKGKDFSEELVSEIRFSNAPRYGLNSRVSKIPQYEWLDNRIEERKSKEKTFMITDPYLEFRDNIYTDWANHPKPPQFRREAPKVHNNDPCTCGSGKKFKKCCKI